MKKKTAKRFATSGWQSAFGFVVFAMATPSAALAQEDKAADSANLDDLYSMTLDEVLALPLRVASETAMSLRESPGIVTVITQEQIRDSGASDLAGILQMVPGILLGGEGVDTVSLGVRGMWAHEGKVSLIIDGHDLTSIGESNLIFGNRFSADMIKQVEVIRGPGSVLYGGTSSLAVIRVTTKGAELDGFTITPRYGRMSDRNAFTNATLSMGKQFGEDGQISAAMFVGDGFRSTGDRFGFDAVAGSYQKYNFGRASRVRPMNFKLDMTYKNAQVSMFYDNYQTETRNAFGLLTPRRFSSDWNQFRFAAKYRFEINDSLVITPEFSHGLDRVYNMESLAVTLPDFPLLTQHAHRTRLKLRGNYTIIDGFSVMAGAEHYWDELTGRILLPTNYRDANAQNTSVYGEATLQSWVANAIFGIRYDHHNRFGDAVVPRLAITSIKGPFHFKVLATRAFRTPPLAAAFALDGSTISLKPETSTTYEVEAGVHFGGHAFTANAFRQTIEDTIVFQTVGYANYLQTGAQGFELSYQIEGGWGNGVATYSFYDARDLFDDANNLNQIDKHAIPGHPAYMVGMPNQKFTLNAHFKLPFGLSINPMAYIFGTHYAYDYTEANNTFDLVKVDPVAVFNVNVRSSGLVEGMSFMLGVNDILDSSYAYSMPNNNNSTPIDAPSRTVMLSVEYYGSL